MNHQPPTANSVNVFQTVPSLEYIMEIAIFFFAHQDDEFGVYQQLLIERYRGRRIICVYLTRGVGEGRDSFRRNQESKNVLGCFGVYSADIVFVGDLLDIDDCSLADSIQTASDWVKSWLLTFKAIGAVYTPAWEGGHPDHDILHALCVQICSELDIDFCLWQFPLYNAFRCPSPFFRVLTPLDQNGIASRSRIPLLQRIRYCGYMFEYLSQWKSLIGLLPFVLLHYVIRGTQDLQRTSIFRIHDRPHAGPLYYERRGFANWSDLSAKITKWLAMRRMSKMF